jgi:hypothetical protein
LPRSGFKEVSIPFSSTAMAPPPRTNGLDVSAHLTRSLVPDRSYRLPSATLSRSFAFRKTGTFTRTFRSDRTGLSSSASLHFSDDFRRTAMIRLSWDRADVSTVAGVAVGSAFAVLLVIIVAAVLPMWYRKRQLGLASNAPESEPPGVSTNVQVTYQRSSSLASDASPMTGDDRLTHEGLGPSSGLP